MKKIKSIEELPIDSTKLCCNFVNTVYSWNGGEDHDFLTDYNAFIEWCLKVEADDKGHLAELNQKAKASPGEATEVMDKIRMIREQIHQLISAIATDDQKKLVKILAEVNPLLADALSQSNLSFTGNSFVVCYNEPMNLMAPVWIVLKSLYDILTMEDKARIKECPSCGWVFFDETKNGKRRWCNPQNCGTKDKMARYTRKLRAQAQTS